MEETTEKQVMHREEIEDMQKKISWNALEFKYYKKSPYWYYMTVLISLLGALDAYLINNILFAGLILIGGATVLLYSGRKPRLLSYEINRKGIKVNEEFYPFSSYQSYWILEKKNENLLLLAPSKKLGLQLVVPLGETNPYEIHVMLSKYLPEHEDFEPFAHKLMEYLGF